MLTLLLKSMLLIKVLRLIKKKITGKIDAVNRRKDNGIMVSLKYLNNAYLNKLLKQF